MINFWINHKTLNDPSTKLRAGPSIKGFTLIELLVSLTIIAILALVTVPHVGRSQKSRAVYDTCSTLVEMMHYAKDAAARTGRTVEFVMLTEGNACFLTMPDLPAATAQAETLFGRVKEDIFRQRYVPAEGVRFTERQGFATTIDGYVLRFDPKQPWPRAWLTVTGDEEQKKLVISGDVIQVVNIEEESEDRS